MWCLAPPILSCGAGCARGGRTDVEFIQRAAERTAAVTAQLLAFSRRQILKLEVIDLNAVIGGWEPVLRRIMGEDCGVVLALSPAIGR